MFVDTRVGNNPVYYQRQPAEARMRVPDAVRQCVVFIGRENASGGLTVTGTAFLVNINITGAAVEGMHGMLVAAKHTAEKLNGKRFGIRLRLKTGEMITQWADETTRWYYHPTEPNCVDAAVAPWEFNLDEMDVKFVPLSMFLTDQMIKSYGIGIGDEVFMSGLFNRLHNEPVVRIGNIAAMPVDPIPGVKIGASDPVSAEGYLIEVRSLGGLSGSPIFVRESIESQSPIHRIKDGKTTVVNIVSAGPFYLMGLMHGHWKIKPTEHDRVDFETTQEEGSIAIGLSIAVPAKKIIEIIHQPEMAKERDEAEKRFIEKWGTTTPD